MKKIFYGFTWRIPSEKKTVYLTFDDGPTDAVTEWTLAILKEYNAKATFFCIGENIAQNPELFTKVQKEGHAIGNHTYNHLNGWHSTNEEYVNNIVLCEEVLQDFSIESNLGQKLYRPPYGKVNPKQFKWLKKNGYKIIMWDILSADFDTAISPEKCAENVLKNIQPGSIIIFHDSLKASKNLKHALPLTLKYLQENDFEMKSIKFALEPN
ncbi:polysaccharide deacetylase family protein [Flavobacterium sp. SM2513]|uniref:polysaccharide deacetylase family protein n=1 Tax=Flavobacterium sp. SM2513 TaxID=3424766 RepID=UPI003D7F877C